MDSNELEIKLFMLEKLYTEDKKFRELVDMVTAKVMKTLQEEQEERMKNDGHG
tara:strand:- start:1904 stop:2062 length:159 start_codon:yes stop_codon:yes gene_type:complete